MMVIGIDGHAAALCARPRTGERGYGALRDAGRRSAHPMIETSGAAAADVYSDDAFVGCIIIGVCVRRFANEAHSNMTQVRSM